MSIIVAAAAAILGTIHFGVLAWDRYGYAAAVVVALMLAWIFLTVVMDLMEVFDRRRWICGLWLACSAIVLFIGPVTYFLIRAHEDFGGYMLAEQWVSAGQPRPQGRPLFVMLSDTHITDRNATVEGFTHGPAKFEKLFRAAVKLNPQFVIISGDLTDRGTVNEWNLVKGILSRHASGDAAAIVLVPGNHDVQDSPYHDPARDLASGYNDPLSARLRYIYQAHGFERLANAWQGSALTASGTPITAGRFHALVSSLSERERHKTHIVIRSRNPAREANYYVDYPAGFSTQLEETERAFADMFPMTIDNPATGTSVIILNSSAHVNPGSSMGTGNLTSSQLDRVSAYMESLRLRTSLKHVIVTLHHAPMRRQTDEWAWRQFLSRKFTWTDIYAHTLLALDAADASRLSRMLDTFALARPDVSVIAAYGHRHEKYLGRTRGGVWAVESPAVVEMITGRNEGFWAAFDNAAQPAFHWVQVQ